MPVQCLALSMFSAGFLPFQLDTGALNNQSLWYIHVMK